MQRAKHQIRRQRDAEPFRIQVAVRPDRQMQKRQQGVGHLRGHQPGAQPNQRQHRQVF